MVADACVAQGVTTVGFIGTKVAMQDGFFTNRMADHGVKTVLPAEEHHEWLNTAIYEELVHGHVLPAPAAAWSRSSTSSGTPAPEASCSAAPSSSC